MEQNKGKLGRGLGMLMSKIDKVTSGQKGDVLIAITTSGNSKNVLEAVKQAKSMGIKTIGVTGGTGGKLAPISDIAVIAASPVTARIQESHLVIFHSICEIVENTLTK